MKFGRHGPEWYVYECMASHLLLGFVNENKDIFASEIWCRLFLPLDMD